MPKQLTEKIFDYRDWQKECRELVFENYFNGITNFLCTATPGAGKTKFGLGIAYEFIQKSIVDRIVIIAPTDNVKRNWAEDAAYFAGLDIDPDFINSQIKETSDFHGLVMTYGALGQDTKFNQAVNCVHHRTLVILDEVHHAGESLTWGDAVRTNFESAIFVLSLSGTAFRSDDCKIPFINYDENNTSKADYSYTYDRAIRENVCRPVYFSVFDGEMKWKVGESEFEHTFSDNLTADQVSKRLKTALDPNGNWVRDVIKASYQKLIELRKDHEDAAVLITAATQAHAKEIAKVVYQVTGINPPVVVSDEGNGADQIKAFRYSKDPFLVSVKMVSEGTDIPRLRIAVYLTIIKSELYFRQLTGRVVRVIKEFGSQDAFIFIPADKEIIRLAEKIQEERDHALEEVEKKHREEKEATGDKDLFGNYIPAIQGSFKPLSSVVTGSDIISVSVGLSEGLRTSVKGNEIPAYLQKERLREDCNRLAKIYAKKNMNNGKIIWNLLHKKWIEKGGKNMEAETIQQLKNRLEFYEKMVK